MSNKKADLIAALFVIGAILFAILIRAIYTADRFTY